MLILPQHITQFHIPQLVVLVYTLQQTVVLASLYQETVLKVLLHPPQPQLLPDQPAHSAIQDSVYTGFKLDKLVADHV